MTSGQKRGIPLSVNMLDTGLEWKAPDAKLKKELWILQSFFSTVGYVHGWMNIRNPVPSANKQMLIEGNLTSPFASQVIAGWDSKA